MKPKLLVISMLCAACGGGGAGESPDARRSGAVDPSPDAAADAAIAPLAFTTVATSDKERLTAIWGASATDVWIATDNTGGGYGRIMHSSDGVTFTDVGSSGNYTGLYAAWGASADDVWLAGGDSFGDSGVRALLHWNGSAWTDHSYDAGVTGNWFGGAFGTATDDVWFCGEQALVHWDGNAFTSQQITYTLDAAWGSAPASYWFVGPNGTVQTQAYGTETEVVAHNLYAVGGASASDVWAVGDGGTALHYDGAHWTPVATGTDASLLALWAAASDDVFAVGASGTILRWNGSAWHAIAVPHDQVSDYYAVWGVPGAAVWVIGDGGAALRADL